MQFKLSSLLIVLAGSAPVLSTTNGISPPPSVKRMHKNVARSFADKSNGLQKRDTFGPGTWYDIHMGPVACDGKHYQPDDALVAMNSPDFAGGSACGKTITIHYQGKSVTAVVRDECPTCGKGGIDMTVGVFQRLASLSLGELQLSWNWGGDDAPAPTHKAPPPPPKPTTTHHTTPTTTHTSTHHSTSSSSSSHTSSSAAPVPTLPTGANNIASLFQLVVDLGIAVVAGAGN